VAVIEQDGRFLLVEEHNAEGLRLNWPVTWTLATGPFRVCARNGKETACAFTPAALVGIYLPRSKRSDGQGRVEDISYLRFAFAQVGQPIPGALLDTGPSNPVDDPGRHFGEGGARHRSPLVLQCLEDYLAVTLLDPLDDASVSALARSSPIAS
jgi:hypothetical protein